MPQPAHTSLVHVLLVWTIVLTVTQSVFVVLFFTQRQSEQVSPFKVLLCWLVLLSTPAFRASVQLVVLLVAQLVCRGLETPPEWKGGDYRL